MEFTGVREGVSFRGGETQGEHARSQSLGCPSPRRLAGYQMADPAVPRLLYWEVVTPIQLVFPKMCPTEHSEKCDDAW